jgi:hypothetical protein
MEFQSNLILSDEIKRTLGKVPSDRFKIPERFGEHRKPLNERRALFEGYVERHRNSDLLCCCSSDGIQMIFCPSDHTGVWAGLIVKGSLGKRTQGMLEELAKEKGLI